jgi:hypothetical protein
VTTHTIVASFLLRLCRETCETCETRENGDPARTAPWRVLLRHIQTGEERSFLSLQDAMDFIERHLEAGQGETAT